MSIQVCHYCGVEGEYPTQIHLMELGTKKEPHTVLVCVDEPACNARWFEQHPDEDYERP